MNTHILWDVSNRKQWEIAAKGSLEHCQQQMEELGMDGYEIHPNEVKDSWNNCLTEIHYECYMDDSIVTRPMTDEELKTEGIY